VLETFGEESRETASVEGGTGEETAIEEGVTYLNTIGLLCPRPLPLPLG